MIDLRMLSQALPPGLDTYCSCQDDPLTGKKKIQARKSGGDWMFEGLLATFCPVRDGDMLGWPYV